MAMMCSSNELLRFCEHVCMQVESVEPVGKIFTLVIDLSAGGTEGAQILGDTPFAMVEVDVDVILDAGDEVVYDVANIAGKTEQMALSRGLLTSLSHLKASARGVIRRDVVSRR